jgi:hypothetical protein
MNTRGLLLCARAHGDVFEFYDMDNQPVSLSHFPLLHR